VSTNPPNPFIRGSAAWAAWDVLRTKRGSRLSLTELRAAVADRAGYPVSQGYVARLRSRIGTGERCHGVNLKLPDLRFPHATP
jgi:hypothetical protein